MIDSKITIEVNGKELEARSGQMLIEVTDANDIYVPRFCYHNKLSISASCRMCLVEVEKALKPLPACATSVMNGMKVFTKSTLATEAQKSVMEFLLINHPLDCPVCDQGGECELQDLAVGYGGNVSRYHDQKRVVQDKDIGPLVRTEMTRCIHCTRCVRFGEEIAGLRELGGTGRGENLEIGTYVEKSMASELSGNIIDLCPVGALTSKPFRFSARTWEMKQFKGIAPHDAIGSNIHIHVKGQKVKRVVPANNEAINEIWISDRDRFSYEGLYSDERLNSPMIKNNGVWQQVDWMTAFEEIKIHLDKVLESGGPEQLGALASANASTEELYLLQKFMRAVGSNNIDHRLQQIDFSDQEAAPLFPWLGQSIQELEQLDAALVIGGYPRKEQPLINHRLRKAALKGASVMLLTSVAHDYNFDIDLREISSPVQLADVLAGIIKAVSWAGSENTDTELLALIENIQPSSNQIEIAKKLQSSGKATVMLGSQLIVHPEYSILRYLAGNLAKLCGASFAYLSDSVNTSGAWLVGAIPHRLLGGDSVDDKGLNASTMLEEKLSAYLLHNIEPELDCWDGNKAITALEQAQCVIAMTCYKTEVMKKYADVLLPIAQYAENEGSYFNAEGVQQFFSKIVSAPGEARPAWKVLRVLGNSFEVDDFNYNSVTEVSDEITKLLGDLQPTNNGAWSKADKLTALNGEVIRITERPMNSVDPLVRRAPALQQTLDVSDGAIHVCAKTAKKLGISDGGLARVKQDEVEQELPVVIDNRLAAQTVLIHASHKQSYGLGPWFGEISINKT